MKVQGKKKEREGREQLRKQLIARREVLDIAPNKAMVKPGTLVTWLPYDSIDVVFNNKNLWVNRQNHHPACITYDFPDGDGDVEENDKGEKNWKWEPLIKSDEADNLSFHPISPHVTIQPPLRPNIVDELRDDLRQEMRQNLSLYRAKKGFDTYFDHGDDLMDMLNDYLSIHE